MTKEHKIPTTLYEKYTMEREHLYEKLFLIEDAIGALTSGNVSSYSLGNRSVSYVDIDKLKGLKAETEDEIDRLEALLSHRSPRNVSVNSFICPSISISRKL